MPLARVALTLLMGSVLLADHSHADNAVLPTMGSIERVDPRLDDLIDSDAQIEVIGSGFKWTEGPVWVKRDGGFLLFSDIPPNRIMKWTADEGVTHFMEPAGYTGVAPYGGEPGSNGLLLDHEERLLLCEHGDRRIARMTWDGGKMTVADRYQGKRFNSPNDLAIHSSGAIYFTDPPYGLPKRENDERRELDFFGVFRVAPDGEVSLFTDEMTRPNGIAFSPDEKTLYIAQSDPKEAIVRAFDIDENGAGSNSRVFYDASEDVGKRKGLPDGMAIDARGNLFATGPGGVLVISPEGKLLGRIDTGQATANCCFGDDGSTLFITADDYLCRVKVRIKGNGW